MNGKHITLKGVRRKIKTQIPNSRLDEIARITKAVQGTAKHSLLTQSISFNHGGIKDSTGRNIKKQYNKVKQLHSDRLK